MKYQRDKKPKSSTLAILRIIENIPRNEDYHRESACATDDEQQDEKVSCVFVEGDFQMAYLVKSSELLISIQLIRINKLGIYAQFEPITRTVMY